MADSCDIEFEGVTTFGVSAFGAGSAATYRYSIALKDDKMNFSMENRSSKKQWFKGGLEVANYVTADNVITGATAADYLKCFQEALSSDGATDSQRKLRILENGDLKVEFVLTLRVLRSTWEAKYTFQLTPVSRERIDILESKLRDLQNAFDKCALLEQQDGRKTLPSSRAMTNPVAEFVALTTYLGSIKLHWTTPGSNGPAKEYVSCSFCVSDCHGGLVIVQPGIYIIGAAVKCSEIDDGESTADTLYEEGEEYGDDDGDYDDDDDDDEEDDDDYDDEEDDDEDDCEDGCASLLKNGECVQVDYFTEECCVASLNHFGRFEQGDELIVTCNRKLAGASKMHIFRLAD